LASTWSPTLTSTPGYITTKHEWAGCFYKVNTLIAGRPTPTNEYTVAFNLTEFFKTIPATGGEMTPVVKKGSTTANPDTSAQMVATEGDAYNKIAETFKDTRYVTFNLFAGEPKGATYTSKVIVTDINGQKMALNEDGSLPVTAGPTLTNVEYKKTDFVAGDTFKVGLTGSKDLLNQWNTGAAETTFDAYAFTKEMLGGSISKQEYVLTAPSGAVTTNTITKGAWETAFDLAEAGEYTIEIKAYNAWGVADSTTSKFTVKSLQESLLNSFMQAKTDGTALRFISTVDSLNYKQVGFVISINGVEKTVYSSVVYESVKANGETVTASDLNAKANYLFTYTIWDIPADQKDTEITVKAFLVENDGTIVYGASKTGTVNIVQNA